MVTMCVSLGGPMPVMPKTMSGKSNVQMTWSRTVSASVPRMDGMVIWKSVRIFPAPSIAPAS